MIDIQITINLSATDPAQLGTQLAAIIEGAQALAESGAVSAETDSQGENIPATPITAETTAATPATKRKKRGRPPKVTPELLKPGTDWDTFDELVRSEMERLSMDDRMPTTANWNSNRDVRLPTMAGVLEAYDVLNLLTLAAKLEMRPPHTALGIQPFVMANGEVTQ